MGKDRPILIYFGLYGCGTCTTHYNKYWRTIVKEMENLDIDCLEIYVNDEDDVPKEFKEYINEYPSYVLCNPESFYRHYTENGTQAKTYNADENMICMLYGGEMMNGKMKMIGNSPDDIYIIQKIKKWAEINRRKIMNMEVPNNIKIEYESLEKLRY